MIKENQTKNSDLNSIRKGVVIIVTLLLLLVFTSVILARTISGDIPGNNLTFGSIQIGIGYHTENGDVVDTDTGILPLFNEETNGGPLTKGNEISRNFFVYNKSTVNNEYFRIYLVVPEEYQELAENIDVVINEITLNDSNEITSSTKVLPKENTLKVTDLTRESAPTLGQLAVKNDDSNDDLKFRKDYQIIFKYPDTVSEELVGTFKFDICTEGVQVKNQKENDIKYQSKEWYIWKKHYK